MIQDLTDDFFEADHFVGLRGEREACLYWANVLTRWADSVSLSKRGWFRFSELLEEYIKAGNYSDSTRRDHGIQLLRRSVLRGEFDHNGRTGVICLIASPLSTDAQHKFRFPKEAADSAEWERLLDCCWLRRADCLRWLDGEGIDAPAKWDDSGIKHHVPVASREPQQSLSLSRGFDIADHALFRKMSEMMKKGEARSAYGAALILAERGEVVGHGHEKSKADRLARRYRREYKSK